MEQLILKAGNDVGNDVFLFVLLLLLVNSLSKAFFDTEKEGFTKRVVLITSSVLVLVFWYFGTGIFKLLLWTFATFGFFDYFGRYIEKLYMWLFEWIAEKVKGAWRWFGGLFTLYKK